MSTTCIVLAGGLGTRLQSTVPGLPKCLAPISGRPFLEWQLKSLSERGIESFVLSLGHRADLVLDELKQSWAQNLSIVVIVEDDLLGTGGAARLAMEKIGLEEALIVNGDTFLGGSLQCMLSTLDVTGGELMRIATVHVPDRARFGGISLDAKQRVTRFLEKGQTGAGPINAGLYRVHRQIFDAKCPTAFSMETQLMPHLVKIGSLHAREMAGPFIDIGIPEDYRLLNTCVHEFVYQN